MRCKDLIIMENCLLKPTFWQKRPLASAKVPINWHDEALAHLQQKYRLLNTVIY